MAKLHLQSKQIRCHEELTHFCANINSIRNKNVVLFMLNKFANKQTFTIQFGTVEYSPSLCV